MRIPVFLFLFLLLCFPLFADEVVGFLPPRVGVVENQYDHVEKLLQKYKISYGIVKYGDLEKKSVYENYDVLFFPCGAELQLTTSVNILSQGVHIEGLSLNDQNYKIDIKVTSALLKEFIGKGGSTYFSDFSFRYLQESLAPFNFYKDFPYIGSPGTLKGTPKGELATFISSDPVQFTVAHSGWVVPIEVRNSETLLSAECETAIGVKQAPIISLIENNKGLALFTSYHDASDANGIMRYLLLRTVYNRDLSSIAGYVKKWEQHIESMVIDRSLAGEASRYYSMKISKGSNDLYFHSDGGLWQIDIFDSTGNFLYSADNIGKDYRYAMEAATDGTVIIKVVPETVEKYHVYSVVTASGTRIVPYFVHGVLGIIAFVLLILYLRFLRIERFRGKIFSSRQR
jgi:hypothetical protein